MLATSLALVLFLFPLAYSPGPGNMFFAANGARFGLAATLPASLGYHLATFAVTAMIGAAFVAGSRIAPGALFAVKWLGAAYVLWLAIKFFGAGSLQPAARPRPAGFVGGTLLLVLNPKAYVIILLMFSQFLTDRTGTGLAWMLLVTTVFTLNNLVAFTVWTLAGDRLLGRLRTTGHAGRLNVAFGLILGGVALWMALS